MRDDQMIKKWTCKIERAVAMLTLKLYLIKHMIIQSVMIRILTSEAWLKKKLLQRVFWCYRWSPLQQLSARANEHLLLTYTASTQGSMLNRVLLREFT